jgi:gas vesicle protein
MDDNPLVLAAGAAILGLAIGLLVPETERENQLMGPSRDNLVDRAQSTAQRVKEAAVDATNEVREVVREEAASRAPEIKEAIKDAAATVGASVKESAGRVKEEAKQAAKESKSGGRGDPQV